MDRVFLDANILFSAAYLPDSRLRSLWSLPGVTLIASGFVVEEARRNVLNYCSGSLVALEELLEGLALTAEAAPNIILPADIQLADKDKPVLSAAIAAKSTHLLTGDRRHFGDLYGRRVRGVLVLTPAQYLRGRARGRERRRNFDER